MWISRKTAQTLEEMAATIRTLRDDNAAERATRIAYAIRLSELKIEHLRELEEYRRRLSVAQANFEWLSVSHNKVSAEWQKMFNSKMNVDLPPLQVQFDRAPTQAAEPSGVFKEAPERPADGANIVEDLLAQGLSFDDMGENAAAKEGLTSRVYNGSDLLMEG